MDQYIEEVEGPVFPGLHAPSATCISGVSGSGKTTLVHRILAHRNAVYKIPVHKVMYCMTVNQPIYDEMRRTVPGIVFHRGVPTEEDLNVFTDGSDHTLLILDDLMEMVVKDPTVQMLFTKFSHHQNISCIYITQNLFSQGKCSRNIAMNIHYNFLLCTPRDVTSLSILAKQTGLGQVLKESYKDCVMQKKYGYQLISLHPADVIDPRDPPRLKAQIHTNIFPGEDLISYL